MRVWNWILVLFVVELLSPPRNGGSAAEAMLPNCPVGFPWREGDSYLSLNGKVLLDFEMQIN